MEKARGYKRTPRFTKRLEVAFSSGGLSFRGILSNISISGIFIRTNKGFAPGTTVDMELMLPDNTVSSLRGIVRRTIKTSLKTTGNGMGVELTRKDDRYENFIRGFLEEADRDAAQEAEMGPSEREPEKPPVTDFEIISCSNCGAKNKVLREKLSLSPKCGKCGAFLPVFLP